LPDLISRVETSATGGDQAFQSAWEP
jgi:hypothetical protein